MIAQITVTAMNTSWDAGSRAAADWSAEPEALITPLAMAPNSATPTAEPIDLLNMMFPVTTPRSDQPTLDCAAMMVGLATSPSPRPTMKQYSATVQMEEPSPRVIINAVPTRAMAPPIRAVDRKPMRR